MEISIGSYKVRIEIVLAIVVLFWIIFGHLLCSCCRVSLFEGATAMSSNFQRHPKIEKAQKELDTAKNILARRKSEVKMRELELDKEKRDVDMAENEVVKTQKKLIELKSRL